jgi:hypothetical protein
MVYFSHFGILYLQKSGNPDCWAEKNIVFY